jgi:NTE family protein
MRRAVVYGGGALWGIGFGVGVAEALRDRGLPLDQADALGTSAGAWVAAAVRLGVELDRLAGLDISPPYAEEGVLERFALEAFGDGHAPGVRAVVARACDQSRPVILDGADARVGQLVAASAAVPGLFSPVRIAGVAYVDGMVAGSSTYADLAPDADHLIVIAPMALPGAEGVVRTMSQEIARWRSRNPRARVDVWTPDAYCCGLVGPDLFDMDAAVDVRNAAYAHVVAAAHV